MFVGVSILGKLFEVYSSNMQYLNLFCSSRHNQYCVYILVGSCGSGWHTAEAEIISSYRAFSNEKIHGRMGVYIGLNSANVTLEAMHYNKSMDVNFNERLIDLYLKCS